MFDGPVSSTNRVRFVLFAIEAPSASASAIVKTASSTSYSTWTTAAAALACWRRTLCYRARRRAFQSPRQPISVRHISFAETTSESARAIMRSRRVIARADCGLLGFWRTERFVRSWGFWSSWGFRGSWGFRRNERIADIRRVRLNQRCVGVARGSTLGNQPPQTIRIVSRCTSESTND
jgi:hypothetical protein